MSFRRSASAVMIAAVLIAIAIVSIVSIDISHRMTADFQATQFALMSRILHSKLRGAEGKAIAAAEMIAAIPSVRAAFDARDREALLAATRAAFTIQKEKYGISQAQFHLPPATSFLRVHNPPKFGEDQTNYRHIVVEVNRVNAIRKGLEVTTSGIGIFGTLPISGADGRPLGSFEMAYEVGPLLDELKNAYGFEMAFFVEEKILKEVATSLGGEVFNDQNRFGDHVNFHSTHAALLRSLVTGGDLSVTEEAHLVRESSGVSYGVLLFPVYNYAKKQIGVMAMARDFGALRSASRAAMVWQTLLGILAAIGLIGVILTVVRGMLLQPLDALRQRIAASADGEDESAIVPPATACDEIRNLADQCERLRRHASGKATNPGKRP
jgi:hypothetical protein